MNMVTPTPDIIEQIKRTLNSFLWGSKVNKVKHTACIAPYDKGGLKMPDVQTILDSQRVSWVKRFFCNDKSTQWKVFFEWQMEKLGGLALFQNTSIAIEDIRNMGLLSFYESVVIAWSKFFTKEINDDHPKILSQSIFFNTHITITTGKLKRKSKKSLFYPKLINKGIIFLKDVIQQGIIASPAEIKVRYNLTGIETFEYISVCKSIRNSQQIYRYIQTAGINCIIPETKAFLACENSKTIYNKLIKTIIERPTSEVRINTLYME